MFDRYTSVPPEWIPLRDLVVAKRKPRSMFVQVSHLYRSQYSSHDA
jgi:hypothetical protein